MVPLGILELLIAYLGWLMVNAILRYFALRSADNPIARAYLFASGNG